MEIAGDSGNRLELGSQSVPFFKIIIYIVEGLLLTVAICFVFSGDSALLITGLIGCLLTLALIVLTITKIKTKQRSAIILEKQGSKLIITGSHMLILRRKVIDLADVREVHCRIYKGDIRPIPSLYVALSDEKEIRLNYAFSVLPAKVVDARKLPCKTWIQPQQLGAKLALFLSVPLHITVACDDTLVHGPKEEHYLTPRELEAMAC
jgi:hypothetical protein